MNNLHSIIRGKGAYTTVINKIAYFIDYVIDKSPGRIRQSILNWAKKHYRVISNGSLSTISVAQDIAYAIARNQLGAQRQLTSTPKRTFFVKYLGKDNTGYSNLFKREKQLNIDEIGNPKQLAEYENQVTHQLKMGKLKRYEDKLRRYEDKLSATLTADFSQRINCGSKKYKTILTKRYLGARQTGKLNLSNIALPYEPRRLADTNLSSKVCIDSKVYTDSKLFNQTFSYVKELSLSDINRTKLDISNYINLKVLNIIGCFIFKKINIHHLSKLDTLHIFNNTAKQVDIQNCANLTSARLSELPKVEKINLNNLPKLKILDLEYINATQLDVSNLSKLTRLTIDDSIHLEEINLQNSPAKYISILDCKALKIIRNLHPDCRFLEVNNSSVAIIENLDKCHNLQYVDVSNTNIEMKIALSKKFWQLPKLAKVIFKKLPKPEEEMNDFLRSLLPKGTQFKIHEERGCYIVKFPQRPILPRNFWSEV